MCIRDRARAVEPQVDNMLKITNDGRKLALDQRLIDPMLPDDTGSKVNACVDNVHRIWEEHADTRAAQLLFCDLSTPKGDGTFNVYDDIREKLIPVSYTHLSGTDRTGEVGASDEAALQGAGRDRGIERESADAGDRADEQHPQSGGGSHPERTDLRLTPQETEPSGDGQESVANEEEVRANPVSYTHLAEVRRSLALVLPRANTADGNGMMSSEKSARNVCRNGQRKPCTI